MTQCMTAEPLLLAEPILDPYRLLVPAAGPLPSHEELCHEVRL